jgi:hypothetical protein
MRRVTILPSVLGVAILLMLLGASPASAGTPPNRLDYNGGAILAHPAIHNLYWDSNWDADNTNLKRASLDAATASLVASDYFAKASQYGVLSATFTKSDIAPIDACGDKPGATIDILTIQLRVTCEAEWLWLNGGPSPFNSDVIYVVYLPAGVTVSTLGISTCGDFGAYHFASVVGIPPVLAAFGYAIVPADCAGNLDGATVSASHEIIETATDLVPATAWIDDSTFDPNNLPAIFKEGEAADICFSLGAPSVRLSTGVLAAPYWSNADGGCVPAGHSFSLFDTFVPGVNFPPLVQATVDGTTVNLPFSTNFEDGSTHTFSFQSTVTDPNNVVCVGQTCQFGHRWVTSDPGGTVTITGNFSHTAVYQSQFLLVIIADPAGAAAGDASLTPSGYFNEGSVATLTTDPFVSAGAGDRYRFDHWNFNGDPSPTTSVLVNGAQIIFAEYALQHQLTFTQVGIPAGVPWTVTVDGTAHAGPFSDYFDDGSAANFAYQTPVPGLAAGTRYVLTGTSPTSGLVVTVPGTVTATYQTQYLLTVSTSGLGANFTHITNSGTLLGTATDATPLAVWLPAATALSLSADASVTAPDGTVFIFQGFVPAVPAALSSPFSTTADYQTIPQLIGGGLSGPGAGGLANSYDQQFEKVQEDIAAGDHAAALTDLKSFINHVSAQSGKAFTTATATTLELDALLIYHDQLCLAQAAGQINPATAAADYSYYSSTVISLGGTPLSPC